MVHLIILEIKLSTIIGAKINIEKRVAGNLDTVDTFFYYLAAANTKISAKVRVNLP